MFPGRGTSKVVIERDYAVNFRACDVQFFGDQRNGPLGYISQGGLDGVQYFQKRPRAPLEVRDNTANGVRVIRWQCFHPHRVCNFRVC